MPYTTQSMLRVIRMEFDVLLFIIGLAALVGGANDRYMNIGFPLLITLAGVFILGTPKSMNGPAGTVVTGLGLYLLLRALNFIALPWLRYITGSFLILTGVVNFVTNMKGGSVGIGKTFSKQSDQH